MSISFVVHEVKRGLLCFSVNEAYCVCGAADSLPKGRGDRRELEDSGQKWEDRREKTYRSTCISLSVVLESERNDLHLYGMYRRAIERGALGMVVLMPESVNSQMAEDVRSP
jgi:hypothetical protein